MAKIDVPTGSEIWRWPEFQAFAKRLGVEPSLPTTRLIIDIGLSEAVKITQTYMADVNRQAETGWPGVVETTAVHNEQFKTFMPVEPCLPDQQDTEGVTDA